MLLADYLQVDGNQKRLSEQSYNKLSSSSIRLKSPALTSRITSATSKSAFKPVKKQRRQSLESSAVNLQRNDSFGVSNNRGAMTKELLTAQLKSFLVEPSTPSAGHQHRKLPVSPQEGQQDNGVHSLDRQSLRNRRPNSTDSRSKIKQPHKAKISRFFVLTPFSPIIACIGAKSYFAKMVQLDCKN